MKSSLILVMKVKALAGDRKMRFHKLLFTLYHRMKISYLNSLVDSSVKIYDRDCIQPGSSGYPTQLFSRSLYPAIQSNIQSNTVWMRWICLRKQVGRRTKVDTRLNTASNLSSYGLERAQSDLQ